MAGHNKWSQIKHKKAKEDSKRGKAFTKLIKEITVTAREGGGDSSGNARLRTLLEKAKTINMPLENVTRAIKRGTGELPGVHYAALIYEGYGPFGMAVIVDTLSDNKNRTVAALRHIFSSHSGNLSETGSVSWMFEKMGVIRVSSEKLNEDTLLEVLLDFDVKDINQNGTFFSIFCTPQSLQQIKKVIIDIGIIVESADLEWVPQNTTTLTDEQTEKALEFLSALHDHDDVQNVYANLA